ncbi:MAG: hypothetical protein HY423_06580 [Candidatus Lambdaproteobacteria bacterium]|nr:hypothetical protein [Candidatus Lambdaproteobacteria bacterium]
MQQLDHGRRQAHVGDTDAPPINDVARRVYGFRLVDGAHWPYVKNDMRHPSACNMMRRQEVWLDTSPRQPPAARRVPSRSGRPGARPAGEV